MKAVIAEKPSVAREIAFLLGATEKKDGYLEGGGYLVTWALGHLVALGMPEDYGILGFQRKNLPILPEPFLLTVRKIKKDKKYSPDPGALKQLKIIEEVISRCDSIIVATDAGREGELIFRYIYQYLKCSKPFERLWISSLAEKAIRQGFDQLRPGRDFEGLYLAAESRSRADWLVGINASQALSIAAGTGIYSLGRVQTPTLALVCRRYLDHKNFSVTHYWQIELEHRKDFISFKSLSLNRWEDHKKAGESLRVIERQGSVTVISVETKTVAQQPPLLFDLTGLQKEANKKLGLSAEETLEAAQSLYEKKYITYPRTGSKHIPEDLWPEIPQLIRALEEHEPCREGVSKMTWGAFNKRIVDDLKITDHHGLLTTGRIPAGLTAKEYALYDMIALRLLESVSQPCRKEITDIMMQVLHYEFIMKGSKTIEPGWRSISGNFSDNETEPVQELPGLRKDETLKIKNTSLLAKNTKPPAIYTEAGLLSAMESAGKHIADEQQRKAIQQIGIGTPATRAAIIETLFSRGYIKKVKQSLVPTDKGLKVFHLVKDQKIADVAMTAEWELMFRKIENGEASSSEFERQIRQYGAMISEELLNMAIPMEPQPELTCPKCKSHKLFIKEKIVKCPSEACGWVQFRSICGVKLSISEIEALINKGRTGLIKGMTSKSETKFDAFLILNEKGQSSFEFSAKRKR